MTRAQVARILKCSANNVAKLERAGYLHPYQDPVTKVRCFQLPDVLACKERLARDVERVTGKSDADSVADREIAEGLRRTEEKQELAELEYRAHPTINFDRLTNDGHSSTPASTGREDRPGDRPQSILEMVGDAVKLAVDAIDVDKVVVLGLLALSASPKAEEYFDRVVDILATMVKPAVEEMHRQTAEPEKEKEQDD